MSKNSTKSQLFTLVKAIPKGKVAYFGQLAKVLGTTAKVVGWLLSGMKIEEWDQIPWYRVVAKSGYISSLKLGQKGEIQKQMLISEGYNLNSDRVDMSKYLVDDEILQIAFSSLDKADDNQDDNRQSLLDFFKARQNLNLSYAFEIQSSIPGPKICFTAGVHGSEPAGVKAIEILVKHLERRKIKLQKGSLTFILGNPQAFLKNRRFLEQNLNRAFQADIKPSYEKTRAVEISNFLKTNSFDFLLDLHSVSVGNFQILVYLKEQAKNKIFQTFQAIKTHFIVDTRDLPGSLIGEFYKLQNKPALVIECGNHTSPEAVQVALYHINQVIIQHQILAPKDLPVANFKISKNQAIEKYQTIEPIKPKTGFKFVDENVTSKTFVKKGEIYAVHSQGKYQAPADSYIIMPDKNPSLDDTDAGFLCEKVDV